MKRFLLKFATSATAVAMATVLSASPIMAAESIQVNDGSETVDHNWSDYAEIGEAKGNGWTWNNGGNDLILENYNAGRIYADGDLTVDVKGNNTITSDTYDPALEVENGNLTVNGESGSSLNINSPEYQGLVAVDYSGKDTTLTVNNINIKGNVEYQLFDADNLIINNSTIEATGEQLFHGSDSTTVNNSTITTHRGNTSDDDIFDNNYLTINDSNITIDAGSVGICNHNGLTINNSNVYVTSEGYAAMTLGEYANITNSHVHATCTNGYYGIVKYGSYGDNVITLDNSCFRAAGPEFALYLNEGAQIVIKDCQWISPDPGHIGDYIETSPYTDYTWTYSIAYDVDENVMTEIHICKVKKDEEPKKENGVIESNTTVKSNLVQTGVMTDMSLYVTGSIAAAGVASIVISFKKRK